MKKLNLKVSQNLLLCTLSLIVISLTGCVSPGDEVYAGNPAAMQLIRPNFSNSTVLAFADKASYAVYNYDYANYQTQFQKAAQYFTPGGWQAYQQSLNASGNIARVEKNKTVVKSTLTAPITIINQGEIGGRYAWKVQAPLLVTYQSGSNIEQQVTTVTLLVVQTVSSTTNHVGISVDQFIAVSNNQPSAVAVPAK